MKQREKKKIELIWISNRIFQAHIRIITLLKKKYNEEMKKKKTNPTNSTYVSLFGVCCLNITASYSWRRFACARNNQLQINKEMPKEKKIQIHAFYIRFFFHSFFVSSMFCIYIFILFTHSLTLSIWLNHN